VSEHRYDEVKYAIQRVSDKQFLSQIRTWFASFDLDSCALELDLDSDVLTSFAVCYRAQRLELVLGDLFDAHLFDLNDHGLEKLRSVVCAIGDCEFVIMPVRIETKLSADDGVICRLCPPKVSTFDMLVWKTSTRVSVELHSEATIVVSDSTTPLGAEIVKRQHVIPVEALYTNSLELLLKNMRIHLANLGRTHFPNTVCEAILTLRSTQQGFVAGFVVYPAGYRISPTDVAINIDNANANY
jgi:hypothetical protein